MPEHSLHNLLLAARQGGTAAEDAAFAELLRLVRMLVRSGIGRQLRDMRDSADVCQSIARSFIVDHRGGVVSFETEQHLVAYLRTVVQSKLASLARSDQALKRGGGTIRLPGHILDGAEGAVLHRTVDPAAATLRAETSDQISDALTDDDRELARLRLRGLDWAQIAETLNQEPQTLRKRWSRLLERLSRIGSSS